MKKRVVSNSMLSTCSSMLLMWKQPGADDCSWEFAANESLVYNFAFHKDEAYVCFIPQTDDIHANSPEELALRTAVLFPDKKMMCIDINDIASDVADFVCPNYRDLPVAKIVLYEVEV